MNKSKKMSDQHKKYLEIEFESEGFDYALSSYSSFEEVKDPIFHDLRLNYLQARNSLTDYIGIDC